MNDELVRGGQGRSTESVEETGTVLGWLGLAAAVIVIAALIWG